MVIRNKKNGKRFTLVELLVAMAVFSILLVLMMQFFSGSQKMWVGMEQKNNLYADARVAMDLMSTLLQSTYYASGGVPFILEDGTSEEAKIYFPTQTQLDLLEDAGSILFVSFQRGTGNRANELLMTVFSDSEDDNPGPNLDFSYFFPPYGAGSINDIGDARSHLKDILNDQIDTTESGNCVTLLTNVTGFRILPMRLSGTDVVAASSNPLHEIPYLVEVQLTLMNQKDFDFWRDQLDGMAGTESERAQEFRLQHQHTFSRAIYLGDRWNRDL